MSDVAQPISPKRINHLGIAVKDLDEALLVWRDALGLQVKEIIDMPENGLRVAFLQCGETLIELLAPLGDGSEIGNFLEKRGGGIHHICLEVDDIAVSTAQAEGQGIKMLGTGTRIGAEGYPVRFAHPKSTVGALVELLEKK